MSLLKQCYDVDAKLKRLRELEGNKSKDKAFKERSGVLLQKAQGVKLAWKRAQDLKSQDLGDVTVRLGDSHQGQVEVLLLQFQEDKASLIKGGIYKKVLTDAEEFSEELNRSTKAIWTEFVDQLCATTGCDTKILDILALANADAQRTADNLKTDFKELTKARGQRDYSSEAVADLRKRVDALKSQREQLPSEFPPAVNSFLQKVRSNQGADLNLLTVDVLEWLQSNNLMLDFGVKSRSSRRM